MKQTNTSSQENQDRRLLIKTKGQQMKNIACNGTGLSPWESEVLIDAIEEVYFSDPGLKELSIGQVKYNCVSSSEGAGKELKNCRQSTVVLTIYDDNDGKDLFGANTDCRSREMRQRRLVRIADEAHEQGGLLSQEDLSRLLMCDVRTIRRGVEELKDLGITVPTRGTIKDIGPGVTHKEVAVRLWIEGKEPAAVATHIKHSIKAVENYLDKFKRVVYLKQKQFNNFEIALTVGISVSAASKFIELYNTFKNKALFKQRIEEINIVGAKYYIAQDEKKRTKPQNGCMNRKLRQP